jgi:hypothetical protein
MWAGTFRAGGGGQPLESFGIGGDSWCVHYPIFARGVITPAARSRLSCMRRLDGSKGRRL